MSKSSLYLWLFLLVVLLLSGAVLGKVVSTGNAMLGILFFGTVFGAILMGMPLLVMWMVSFLTLVFCGTVVYNTDGLENIWWGAYLLSGMLIVPAIFSLAKADPERGGGGSGMAAPAILFFAIIVFSAIVNQSNILDLLAGIKIWVLYGGIWAAMALLPLSEAKIQKWLKIFFWVGVVQIIPVLYQFLYVKKQRDKVGADIASSDVVVGSFGGSPTGGGMTGALAAFLVFLIASTLAMRRFDVITRSQMRYMLFFYALPLLFVEVKAIFFYLPVALYIIFNDMALRNPLKFLGGGVALAGILVVMLFVYQAFHWGGMGGDMMTNAYKMFAYSFAEEAGSEKEEIGVMSRVEVVTFWFEKHHIYDPVGILVGHGPASCKTTGLVHGEIANRYEPKEIDRTGIAVLLWDFGVMGLLAFSWFVYVAYRQAGRLMKRKGLLPWEKAAALSLHAIFPLFLMSLSYRNDVPYSAPIIFLFYTALGLLSWLDKTSRRRIARERKAQP